MKRAAFIIIAIVLLVGSCGREKPSNIDGGGMIFVTIVDTTGSMPGSTPGEISLLGDAEVNIQSRTHVFTGETTSSPDGMATFVSLPSGEYSLFARMEVVVGAQKKVFTGYTDIILEGSETVADTLFASPVIVNALMINEIFYCGSDRSKYYFYDQFVELYNSSEDTLYLDGLIVTRNSVSDLDEIEDIDHVRATYAFQFPGKPVVGREYPILPRQYIVIAADAIDHTMYADNSVDLSGADWEFFNALGNDYDVPGVPNLDSIRPESTTDFLINVSSNGVVVATGEEWSWEVYINSNGYESIRVTLPLYTVIDGVEYASTTDKTKELTVRVDAGFAGIGCSKYSGQSTERREIGIDTNNSTFDFTLIPRPTPGYSHVDED